MKIASLLIFALLPLTLLAADKAAARKPASAPTVFTPSEVKAKVLAQKPRFEELAKAEIGTDNKFSVQYNTLACHGAHKLENDESAVLGVCTFQAGAWQTAASMVVLVKYDGLEVKSLFKDQE